MDGSNDCCAVRAVLRCINRIFIVAPDNFLARPGRDGEAATAVGGPKFRSACSGSCSLLLLLLYTLVCLALGGSLRFDLDKGDDEDRSSGRDAPGFHITAMLYKVKRIL